MRVAAHVIQEQYHTVPVPIHWYRVDVDMTKVPEKHLHYVWKYKAESGSRSAQSIRIHMDLDQKHWIGRYVAVPVPYRTVHAG